jgi:hypothetical protein
MTVRLRPMEPRERGELCLLHDETGEVEADATHWLVDDRPDFPHPVPVCEACGREHVEDAGED